MGRERSGCSDFVAADRGANPIAGVVNEVSNVRRLQRFPITWGSVRGLLWAGAQNDVERFCLESDDGGAGHTKFG